MADPPPGPYPRRLYDEETTTAYWDLFTDFSGQFDGWRFWMSPRFTSQIAKDRDRRLKPNEEHSCGLWMVGRDRKHAHPTVVFFGDTKSEKMTSGDLKSLRKQSSALLLKMLASRKLNASDVHIGVYGLPYQPSCLREHLEYRVYQVPDEHILKPPTRVAVPSPDGGRFDNDQLRVITMGGLVEDKGGRVYGIIIGNFYETSFQELIVATSPGERLPAVDSAIPQPSEGESSLEQQTSQPKEKGIEQSSLEQEKLHPEAKGIDVSSLEQQVLQASQPKAKGNEQSSLEQQTPHHEARGLNDFTLAQQITQRTAGIYSVSTVQSEPSIGTSDPKAKGDEQLSPEQQISQPTAKETPEQPSPEQQTSYAKAKDIEQSSPEQQTSHPTAKDAIEQQSTVETTVPSQSRSEVTDLGDELVRLKRRSPSFKEPEPNTVSRDRIGSSNLHLSNRAHGWMLVRIQSSKITKTQASMPSLDPTFAPNRVAKEIPSQVESESNEPSQDPKTPPTHASPKIKSQIIWVVTASGVIVADAPEIAGVMEAADGKLLKIWKVMTSQMIGTQIHHHLEVIF